MQEQSRFVFMIAILILYAFLRGYRLTFGDAYRDPRAHFPYGHPKSFHKKRLAVDFNLFKKNAVGKWVYLENTLDHKPLGEFWEMLGGTWGGRFEDGNHYSLGEERDA